MKQFWLSFEHEREKLSDNDDDDVKQYPMISHEILHSHSKMVSDWVSINLSA